MTRSIIRCGFFLSWIRMTVLLIQLLGSIFPICFCHETASASCYSSNVYQSTSTEEDGGGGGGDSSCRMEGNHRKIGQLKPWQLPQPTVFTAFEQNSTVTLSNGNELKVATGRVTQINAVAPSREAEEEEKGPTSTSNNNHHPHDHHHHHHNTTTTYAPEFHVLSNALRRESIETVLDLLEGYSFWDDDPDTVDGMPTYEMFIDSPDLGSHVKGPKYRDTDPNFLPQRQQLRHQLQSVLQPYLETILTPYVRETYPQVCANSNSNNNNNNHNTTPLSQEGQGRRDRLCTPCYSLIRRYRHGERQSHATHHDGHAIVTVVVSLSDYHRDYRGGLYVSTGYGQSEYMALNKGDAVVHQSNLLHGVKVFDVLDDRPKEDTKRWSWILWYKDSTQCQDDYSHEWFAECAAEGDPLCLQLHSTKVGNIPGISQTEVAQQVLQLNLEAAQRGAGMAAVKVARAYLHQLPSTLPFSAQEAQRYFQMAIASHNPDGHYGMAQLLLQHAALEQPPNAWRDERVTQAVYHLESAALLDHAFSIFNLGMVHTYGYSTGVVNGTLAAEWFAASGLPEGYYVAAQQAKAVGNRERYEYCARRAQTLGFMAPWRKQARESTGSGGAAGVDLNLPWPLAMDGRRPPQL